MEACTLGMVDVSGDLDSFVCTDDEVVTETLLMSKEILRDRLMCVFYSASEEEDIEPS